MKKLLGNVLKVAFSVAVLGYLGYQVARDESFAALATADKDWTILACTVPICLAAVTATILRWQMLIRTLGLEFGVRDALRAGFLGYLVNLMPFGVVGGDSLKAVMLIHRNGRRKTEAVATVIVDRVIGLYSLLLLAAIASLFLTADQLARLTAADRDVVVRLCYVVQTVALVSSIGLIVMLIPGVTDSRLWDMLEHLPIVGPVLHKLVGAMRTYRRRVDILASAIGISLAIHLLYSSSVVLMTIGIGIAPEHRPAVGSIFVIVPPAMIAGALPIGAYEVTMNVLFRSISSAGAPQNAGLLIALGYRLIQIGIASIGLAYWLTSRSEVRELMHEAQDTEPEHMMDEQPVAASPSAEAGEA